MREKRISRTAALHAAQCRRCGRIETIWVVETVPSASLLNVIAGVKAVLPSIQQQLPAGLHGDVIYDSTVFVTSAIHEVERSLAETVLMLSPPQGRLTTR